MLKLKLKLTHVFLILNFLFTISLQQSIQNTYIVSLSGSNEVSKPGDPSANGNAILSFSSVTGSLFYDIRVEGIKEATAINLLFGSSTQTPGTGTVGLDGALISLLQPLTLQTYPSNNTLEIFGVVPCSLNLISSIVGNPGNYFIQVYTSRYPSGACRGQLATPNGSATITYSNSNLDLWSGYELVEALSGINRTSLGSLNALVPTINSALSVIPGMNVSLSSNEDNSTKSVNKKSKQLKTDSTDKNYQGNYTSLELQS